MAGITLAQAEAKLAVWMAADEKVAGGQAVDLDGRRLTRADAAEIRRNIAYWDGWCRRLGGGVPRIGRIVLP